MAKEFEPHMMYGDGKAEKVNTYSEHLKLKKKGWGHSKSKMAKGGAVGKSADFSPRHPMVQAQKDVSGWQTMKDGGKPKGLWANIHAKRKRGEAPAKPGDKDYPKTLNVEEGGLMNGPSHDEGGIDIEVEGGEIIINKNKNNAAGKHEKDLLNLNNNPDDYMIVKKNNNNYNWPSNDARKRGK